MSSTCPSCGAALPRLRVGDVLHGFCYGYFGRDSYGEKTVIAIGPDWVLVSEMAFVGASPPYRQVRQLHAYSGDPDDLLEFTRPEPDQD